MAGQLAPTSEASIPSRAPGPRRAVASRPANTVGTRCSGRPGGPASAGTPCVINHLAHSVSALPHAFVARLACMMIAGSTRNLVCEAGSALKQGTASESQVSTTAPAAGASSAGGGPAGGASAARRHGAARHAAIPATRLSTAVPAAHVPAADDGAGTTLMRHSAHIYCGWKVIPGCLYHSSWVRATSGPDCSASWCREGADARTSTAAARPVPAAAAASCGHGTNLCRAARCRPTSLMRPLIIWCTHFPACRQLACKHCNAAICLCTSVS